MTTTTPGSAALLTKRCQEILDWKSSGLLVDGELRKMAASLENVRDGYRLTVAENQTATEAMQEVVRIAARPDEDGVREATVDLDPADIWDRYCAETSRAERSPQGALAFGVDATLRALSTTGHPEP